MTHAPDPGLADLIAAHKAGDRWTDFTYPPIFSDKPFVATTVTKMVNCSCGEAMTSESHPSHVALVVEQHTNGRITELEATIARVIEGAQMLVESFQRVERGGNHLYDASTHRCADNLALLLAEAQGPEHLRAALEGEQQ